MESTNTNQNQGGVVPVERVEFIASQLMTGSLRIINDRSLSDFDKVERLSKLIIATGEVFIDTIAHAEPNQQTTKPTKPTRASLGLPKRYGRRIN